MSQHKTEYVRYLNVPAVRDRPSASLTFEVRKTQPCPRAHHQISQWYGWDTIGPRVYGLYTCKEHGNFRVRL